MEIVLLSQAEEDLNYWKSTTQLHSYAVTQLHKVSLDTLVACLCKNWAVTLGRKKYNILYIYIILYIII